MNTEGGDYFYSPFISLRLKPQIMKIKTVNKYKNTFLCLILLCNYKGISQKLYFDLCTGVGSSIPKVKWEGSSISNNAINNNERIDSRSFYTFSITAQLSKNFYLKTELGTNSTENRLDFEFQNTQIKGLYRADYFYWAFLPELRFFKNDFLYLNIGYASYQSVSSSLTGVNSKTADDFRGDASGSYIFNIGVHPKFEMIGFIFNLGHHIVNGTSRDAKTTPTLGFSQWNFKVGVSYQLK
jgi:hypothetical protein